MVDVGLMAATFEALPRNARILLLRMRSMSSVEAGAVLGELCQGARWALLAANSTVGSVVDRRRASRNSLIPTEGCRTSPSRCGSVIGLPVTVALVPCLNRSIRCVITGLAEPDSGRALGGSDTNPSQPTVDSRRRAQKSRADGIPGVFKPVAPGQ